MIRLALSHARRGDILVIAAQGNSGYAYWGGDMSRQAQNAGVLAVVIDGAARDAQEVKELGFPVFARATATAHAPLDAPWGEINSPVACGHIVVSPGDIVVADEDGVVAIPPPDVDAVADTVDSFEGFEFPPIDGIYQRMLGQGLVVDTDSA